MEKTKTTQNLLFAEEENNKEKYDELISTLPRAKGWTNFDYYQYEGFWYPSMLLPSSISFQRHFRAKDSDIILTSCPKSGTTWLKSLAFAIVNRSRHPLENNPLLTNNPHDLVPFLHGGVFNGCQSPDLDYLPPPRIFATHLPFSSLPHSLVASNCRVVYICRNPFDQFVSLWHFLPRMKEGNVESITFDEAFDKFCNGVHGFGPFWDHIIGYWKASLEQPHRMLFLKYEDLKNSTILEVKKLAEFLGCPFSKDEENQGVVDEIVSLCSFDNLKDLEVNKTGLLLTTGTRKASFFRKAKVGDWENYFNASMIKRLEKIIAEKLDGYGLTFKTS